MQSKKNQKIIVFDEIFDSVLFRQVSIFSLVRGYVFVFVFVFVIVFVFLWASTCPLITLTRCLEGLKTIILFFLYVN